MDGVKVTYIETRFVTSDAAGFKDLVQRLTGKSPTATVAPAPAAAAAPHRPRACCAAADYCGRSASAAAAAAAPQQGYHYHASTPSAAVGAHEPRISSDGRLPTPCLDEATYGVGDFAGLFYGGSASQNAQLGHGGYCSDYFQC